MKLLLSMIAILSSTFLFACDRTSRITSIEREDLFTLDIGIMEDQIALFDLGMDQGIRLANHVMMDGLFYISDGNGAKILRYNSFGDLLFMIYNDETNPPPMTLRPLSEGSLVTRWSVRHNLNEPGEIAVDSRRHIYVRDRLPTEQHRFDTETRSLLNNVILHFDADGRFMNYLGREGVDGTPFPRIEGIYSSINDELAVICRHSLGWDIYWFNSDGMLLFMVQLNLDALPIPPDRENVFPSLDRISVAVDERALYIKVDYFTYVYDESTNLRIGIEPDSSVIWVMNVETGVWMRYVDIPFFEHTAFEQNRRVTHRMHFSLLGMIRNGRAVLTFPVDDGYSLLIISTDTSGAQYRGFISVDNDQLQFNAFSLSADGILSGLLVDDWQVRLAWWRLDRFIGGS